jgi:Ca-activated chloride channel homolog
VRDQVTQVQIAQVFRNTGGRDMEAVYLFPVPPDAVVSDFVLTVDGREFPARLYSKEEARSIYESIVRRNEDPALLEYMGHGMLQTSVFPLPAGAVRTVTLRYTQLCKRDSDLTEMTIPLAAGRMSSQPIERLEVSVRIDSVDPIRAVYSPTFELNVTRPNDRTAEAKLQQAAVVPAEDLRLFWHLSQQPVGATVLSFRPDANEDGFFLLLASPEAQTEAREMASKTVLFVLDRSGSMSGQKIVQAREALKFVLNNLRDGDTFNIIAFDSRVEAFRPELERFTSATRAEALGWVDNIRAGGGTAIDEALRITLNMITDDSQPNYIIFLTDGQPTVGERNEMRIAENARGLNRHRARLFCFGVGYDVNARLLDRLASENFGVSDYVRPNEDIEVSVSRFFSKMSAPVLADVRITLGGIDVNRTYPRTLPDLFSGGQIVWVGRYQGGGETSIQITGRVGQETRRYDFAAQLAEHSPDETFAFVEKLWAVRRVGEIIDQLDLHGQNQELVDELVQLSTRHGILTPYTAFLADERTDLLAARENTRRAGDMAREELGQVAGEAAVNYRAGKAEFQQMAQATPAGVQSYLDARGRRQQVDNCQVVANEALFRRDGRWVDPAVTAEEMEQAEVVTQFSERYFELARENAPLRSFLAMSDGAIVKVGQQVYRIEPAAAAPQG